jgi:hypothetical protein
MSVDDVMSRVAALQALIVKSVTPEQPTASAAGTASPSAFGAALDASSTGGSTSSQALLASVLEQSSAAQSFGSDDGSGDGSSFGLPALPSLSPLDQLTSLLPSTTAPTVPAAAIGGGGQAVLAAAESQVGVTEQPPGSNDGPQLAVYRSAVAGAAPGEPWCAYFASWASAQAGEPLGASGQGLGAVSEVTSWASSTGRLLPPTATPAPGDLILFGDRHIGIVESVNPDGSLTTVEGNYANAVTRVQRSPSEATGYVQM